MSDSVFDVEKLSEGGDEKSSGPPRADDVEKLSEGDDEKSSGPLRMELCCGGLSHDCDKPVRNQCGGCLTMAYCSRTCQKAHWSTHKSTCKVWKKLMDMSGREIGKKIWTLMEQEKHAEVLNCLDLFLYEKHKGKLDVILAPLYGGVRGTLLIASAQEGNLDIAQRLIDLGNKETIDTQMPNGGCALIMASQEGHVEIVRELLKAGANRENGMIPDGSTALMVAAQRGLQGVVDVLCEFGADVNKVTTTMGNTSLIVASQHGHTGVVKTLLDYGAQIDYQRSDGVTAIMMATQMGQLEVVQLLIDSGASINLKANDGCSSLLKAAAQGLTDITIALLAAGADIHMKNHRGTTALDAAEHYGHPAIVDLLEDAEDAEVDRRFK